MAAGTKKTSVSIVRVYGLPPNLRPQTREQADRLRVAAFEVREDIKRLATVPADSITPGEFAELRRIVALVFLNAAACLDDTAEMLDTLAALNVPDVGKA